MYIGQAPQETKNETAPASVKKRNKASFVVFFVNLFLMAVAFLMIKNHDKSRIESQKDSSNVDEGALAKDAAVTEDVALPVVEVNQTKDPAPAESNVGISNTQPVIVTPKNVGVSATAPSVVSNTSPQKPAKKTRTS